MTNWFKGLAQLGAVLGADLLHIVELVVELSGDLLSADHHLQSLLVVATQPPHTSSAQ